MMRPRPRGLSTVVLLTSSLFALLAPTGVVYAADPAPTAPGGAASEPKLQADGPALLRQWVPPEYPRELLKARKGGMVTVRLVVGPEGKVTSARALEDSDADFTASALAAVKAWGFTPALEEEKPVSCCLETLVAFSPDQGQRKPSAVPPADLRFDLAPRTGPQPRATPPGECPVELVERKFGGRVRFSCTISADGRIVGPRITAASHVEFVRPALEALNQWEFAPGMQGDLAVSSPVDGVVSFDPLASKFTEIMAANGFTAPGGSPLETAPEIVFVADPVWPTDLLLKGEGGNAAVEFTVNDSGAVEDLRLLSASQPEFGQALLAATELWVFNAAVENNHVVPVRVRRSVEFTPVPADADGNDPVARVLAAARQGTIGTARGLDAKLSPIYRVAPGYPTALRANGAPAGRAELEIVIDREGRVRLPRIVSATQPEFGWAAATAAAQWVFSSPRRGGEPVDVKVRIPFEFAAPTS